MGTGNRIRVFKDAWILGLNRRRITLEGREVEDHEICVALLIEPNERRLDGKAGRDHYRRGEGINTIHPSESYPERRQLKVAKFHRWDRSIDRMVRPKLVYHRIREDEEEVSRTTITIRYRLLIESGRMYEEVNHFRK